MLARPAQDRFSGSEKPKPTFSTHSRLCAMETSLIGTFQFIVRKNLHFHWPRAETPTHYITFGIHTDLNEAAKMAVREMIDFLDGDNLEALSSELRQQR